MPELKAYIFSDWIFCWVLVVLAENEEQAREFAKPHRVSGCDLEVRDLGPGILAEGGGNG